MNLAMELLTDPDVLFLDEPTSGLSSEDAHMVMKVWRLADAGKTILITIHQPSLEVFRMMDTLALIAKDKGSRSPQAGVFRPCVPRRGAPFSIRKAFRACVLGGPIAR